MIRTFLIIFIGLVTQHLQGQVQTDANLESVISPVDLARLSKGAPHILQKLKFDVDYGWDVVPMTHSDKRPLKIIEMQGLHISNGYDVLANLLNGTISRGEEEFNYYLINENKELLILEPHSTHTERFNRIRKNLIDEK